MDTNREVEEPQEGPICSEMTDRGRLRIGCTQQLLIYPGISARHHLQRHLPPILQKDSESLRLDKQRAGGLGKEGLKRSSPGKQNPFILVTERTDGVSAAAKYEFFFLAEPPDKKDKNEGQLFSACAFVSTWITDLLCIRVNKRPWKSLGLVPSSAHFLHSGGPCFISPC